jgi:xanthine dehydrogenase YagR molybdenum-binding subunit
MKKKKNELSKIEWETGGEVSPIEIEAPEEKEIPTWEETTIIGKKIPRVDSYERVSGCAKFSSDINLPGMLYAKVLRSPHPHADIIDIDISKAESLPGVKGVLCYKNAPKIPWHRGISSLFDNKVRFAGEEVAAVVAEDAYIAQDALNLIEVKYKPLPFVVDPEEAMETDAPKLSPDGNVFRGEPVTYSRGDVDKGLEEADIVLERRYSTPLVLHCPTETHVTAANWDGDNLTLWDSTQGVFRIQEQAAELLKIPVNKVRVICPYMGGAFGSKLSIYKQTIIAALFAKKTGRPVKIIPSRQENMLAFGNRPSSIQYVKAGVKKDGTLTALSLRSINPMGAYLAGATCGMQLANLYRCANVKTEEYMVFINTGPACPMRAPGMPQGAFALEQIMDELAEKLNIDPIELRIKNNAEVAPVSGKPFRSKGLTECMQEGAKIIGWDKRKKSGSLKGRKKKGIGMACGLWSDYGGPPSTAMVKINYDGTVNLIMGASDLGTGTRTVMSMIVAEELGVPLKTVEITSADTETTFFTNPSGGSKTVPSDGPAARLAAYDAKQKLLALAAKEMEVEYSDLGIKDGIIFQKSNPEKKFSLKEVAGKSTDRVLVGIGKRGPNPYRGERDNFCCHFAEVEVDSVTGDIRLLRYVAAHDSGRALNRFTYDNQIYGGIAMSIGFTFNEERIMDKATGRMLNNNFQDYKIATMLDMPKKITTYEAKEFFPGNNINAKGLGEPPVIPPPAAIANAIYNALGTRFFDLPLTPDKIIEAIKEGR